MIQELIDISRFYGTNKEAVIAGGGNTSCKDEDFIWVKASGISLGDIDENGFVKLYRKKLQEIAVKSFNAEPDIRELEVKETLYASCVDPANALRPSVETNLHETLNYRFVVHLHPTMVNALLCGRDSRQITHELFGEEALYIPYTDPGYILFMKFEEAVSGFRKKFSHDPKLLFLENHGIFFSADTCDEIRELYDLVIGRITSRIESIPQWTDLPPGEDFIEVLPALRMMLSKGGLKTLKIRHNSLTSNFYSSKESFSKISNPFSPDIIVYCKANYLYIDQTGSSEQIRQALQTGIRDFEATHGYTPKIILIKNMGLVAAEDNANSAELALDIFEDLMKISYYSNWFGGPRFMTPEQIDFIENWELENYRRKMAKGAASSGKVAGKIAIVTGGAMGFGAGIAEDLFRQGANVVIADINQAEGEKTSEVFNKLKQKNKAIFVHTDVSNPVSVENLIRETVRHFGGLDMMISNAGILKAGGLDEMDFQSFERMTKVNYSAYFLCAKYAAAVMKLQSQYHPGHFSDIIQINSKSGLKGSNKNFAYAGGKFGGIGLTQSFAMELMPFRIKVNAICPGNFFDGPLWSDPETGLFVQYLNTGKVPGAQSIEDVKRHYEEQVPAKRGCRVEDVMKAIYYATEQLYETGQAIPVTGGQSMLH